MSDIQEKTEILPAEGAEQNPILHIDNFDGPLDLLWDLIKKAKIDVTEITISHITEQYMGYMKLMEKLNVRVATEFVRMASELLFYKSCALLPAGQIEDEYFVPPLPPELVQKLLEFKKFQNASRRLVEEFETSAGRYARINILDDIIEVDDYGDVSLFDLLKAFAEVIESQKAVDEKEIVFDEILVSDRIEHIKKMLAERDVLHFPEIFTANPSRMEIVVTFMAILEMARTRVLRLLQHKIFGIIRIVRNTVTGMDTTEQVTRNDGSHT
ncbi:MAG: segregation/condensation protein A [Spirochaetes bacterium]|nr:segregation/condensation protein A [Spirochaetota bacterium]